MLKARKKNRIVRIPEDKVPEYKKLGYYITDDDGSTVYAPEDKDATIALLRKENQLLKLQVTEKNLIIKALKAKSSTKASESEKTSPQKKGAETKVK